MTFIYYFNFQNLKQTNLVLKKVLLLFPNYCLGRGMMDLARNQLEADIYDRFGKNIHDRSAIDTTQKIAFLSSVK